MELSKEMTINQIRKAQATSELAAAMCVLAEIQRQAKERDSFRYGGCHELTRTGDTNVDALVRGAYLPFSCWS